MRTTKRALSLILLLAVAIPFAALPAASFGQSAGDDQYVDPFDDGNGDGNGGQNDNGGNGGQSQPDQPSSEPAPAPEPEPTTAAANPAVDEATSAQNSLPRTGLPLTGLFAAGVVLAAGGLALRRAWPLPD